MQLSSEYRERYLRDPVPIRLGNLCSSLCHIAQYIDDSKRRDTAIRMINECKWFIEWTAAETEPEVAEQLVNIQVTLAGWQRGLAGESRAPFDPQDASRVARQFADRVL